MARFVRDEKRTYPFTWLTIGGLFALSAFWAVYAEFTQRVPWEKDQTAFYDLEFSEATKALEKAKANYKALSEAEPLKSQIAERTKLEEAMKGGEYAAAKKKLAELQKTYGAAEQEKTFGSSDLDETYYYRNVAEYERDAKALVVRKLLAKANKDRPDLAIKQGNKIYRDPTAKPKPADLSLTSYRLSVEVDRMTAHVKQINEARQNARDNVMRDALADSAVATEGVITLLNKERKHQARIDAAVVTMARIQGPSDPVVAETDPAKRSAAVMAARTKACEKAPDTLHCIKWLKLEPSDKRLKQLNIAVGRARRPLADAELRYTSADDNANPKFDPKNLVKTLVGPLQIRQVVTHWMDYKRDVDIEQVDRCQTCHMGADRDLYTAPYVAYQFRSHPQLDDMMRSHAVKDFGCTVCHQGQGRATNDLAHSGWELVEKHGKERWKYIGDYYWEDPLLMPGKLENIVIDGDNDALDVKFGKKKASIKLEQGTFTQESALYAAIQKKVGEVLTAGKKPVEGYKAVVRRLDGRVSIGFEATGAAPKPAKGKKVKLPRVEITFTKPALASMLGFHGVRTLKEKGKLLYSAVLPPALPIRTPVATASAKMVNTPEDYSYTPPRGADGLQVPDAQRDHFIQALPGIEAGCLRCHNESADLVPHRSDFVAVTSKLKYQKAQAEYDKDPEAYREAHGTSSLPRVEKSSRQVTSMAPTVEEGRDLFRQLNCNGCHLLEGYSGNRNAGPQLNDLSAKVTPEWLISWMRDPRGWRAKTAMPNLWPVPLDPSSKLPYQPGSPEYERWDKERDLQTLAISAYLYEKSEESKATAGGEKNSLRATIEGYADVEGSSVEDGKSLFEAYGCQGCHAATDSGKDVPQAWRMRERDLAPTLSNLANKTNADWVAYWVENPSRYWHGTSMPSLRLNRKESASIAKYLVSLSSKPPARAEVTKEEVLRVSDPAKRKEMVACDVAGGKQMSLVDCGAKVIAHRGCYGCHQIDGFGHMSPIGPELTGYAKKDVTKLDFGYAITDHHLHTNDTFATLKLDSPRIYRRDRTELRMGDFDLSDREIRALVVFLKGSVASRPATEFDPLQKAEHEAVIEGRQLVQDLNCSGCHVIEGRGGDIDGWRQAILSSDAQRRAPWLDGEGARVQPEWLFSFLRDPKAHGIRPWLHPEWVWGDEVPKDKRALRMPNFNLTPEQWTSIVRYFSAWDKVPYPYEVPEVKQLSTNEKLYSLTHMNSAEAGNCLSCHFHGEFPVDRAKGDIYKMAPNLAMVQKRLRPEWTEQWLLRPANYMPYTKMLAFWAFKDRASTAKYWPKESDPYISPPPKGWDQVPGFEKLTGPEQARLVRDFLYALDPNVPFPKVGEEADSPHVNPKAKMQAKGDKKGGTEKAPRTGAIRTKASM